MPIPQPTDPPCVVATTLSWFEDAARELPWRASGTTPWGVLVSEFMLQQTPVSRVLDPWQQWMSRWPTADDLASEPSGSAVAAWGRLGYPRRALRLHGAAVVIAERHSGQVPRDMSALMALPGVGRYTAAAVISFAHGGREAVLDTNVRRVLARITMATPFRQPPPRQLNGDVPSAGCPRTPGEPPNGLPRRWSSARSSVRRRGLFVRNAR